MAERDSEGKLVLIEMSDVLDEKLDAFFIPLTERHSERKLVLIEMNDVLDQKTVVYL